MTTLPAWLDYLEKRFSYKKVQFNKVCPPVNISCSPVENINETPAFFACCHDKLKAMSTERVFIMSCVKKSFFYNNMSLSNE